MSERGVKLGKNRLEAFSDGVLAIIITIMVLELKVPHGDTIAELLPLVPVLLSYVLSFIYLGIYWNNHHHMLHTCHTVTGSVLWANLHLLFWLSLVPFTTGWMGENQFAIIPVATYGLVLLMASIAYRILQQRIITSQGEDSILKNAIGNDWKGKLSPLLYIAAIGLSFLYHWLSVIVYVIVALMWVIPDRRIEHIPTGKETLPCFPAMFLGRSGKMSRFRSSARSTLVKYQTSATARGSQTKACSTSSTAKSKKPGGSIL